MELKPISLKYLNCGISSPPPDVPARRLLSSTDWCLIIDEVGHCEFDKENTRLFFDLIDRRYNKEGNFNMVFTSNKNPSQRRSNFNEDDAPLCSLDRIFDDATVFNIKGESFRDKHLETIALQTSRVKAPGSSEVPTPQSKK